MPIDLLQRGPKSWTDWHCSSFLSKTLLICCLIWSETKRCHKLELLEFVCEHHVNYSQIHHRNVLCAENNVGMYCSSFCIPHSLLSDSYTSLFASFQGSVQELPPAFYPSEIPFRYSKISETAVNRALQHLQEAILSLHIPPPPQRGRHYTVRPTFHCYCFCFRLPTF